MHDEDIDKLMKKKYRRVYSLKLDKYVYILTNWIPKSIFKKYKTLFGYTDIGWTVKHPKTLIKLLVDEEIWYVDN